MGLFSSKKEGGLMDVIRCDEREYVIWKWSPDGYGNSRKENAIRYGSSLKVRDGEVAVFVYKQSDGTTQDFIVGPYNDTIKTANFPILTSLVGLAFGGNSPFQAEIYFINLAGAMQMPFFVNPFSVADPRFMDFTVPVSVKGTITFNIKDYKAFIKLNRMIEFDSDDLIEQVRPAVIRYVKNIVTNTPAQTNTPLIQIERQIEYITSFAETKLKDVLSADFGLNVKRVDISEININKECDEYLELKSVTKDIQSRTLDAQANIGIKNMADQQAISAENMQESLRIQREETQRLQKLQTESVHMAAHQINVQGAVAMTAAESLGQLGASGGSSMGGDGFNPAGMMTGMMMGTAVGGGMTNMMNNAMQGLNQPQPPSPPQALIANYYVAVNGAQTGPFTMLQMQQMATQGSLTTTSLVWKQGMRSWDTAANVPEIATLFAHTPPPPIPPIPPLPPTL